MTIMRPVYKYRTRHLADAHPVWSVWWTKAGKWTKSTKVAVVEVVVVVVVVVLLVVGGLSCDQVDASDQVEDC